MDHHVLYNVGLAHLERYQLTGVAEDLTMATSALRDALCATGTEQQRYGVIARDLANALLQAEDGTGEALQLLKTAAEHPAATAMARFDAATAAARVEIDHRDALHWWRLAVGLLPMLAWRGSRYRDREVAVGRFAASARAAAACAMAIGEGAEAIGLLETGRSILWNQLLEARADLDRLQAVQPALADRMASIRAQLDRTHYV